MIEMTDKVNDALRIIEANKIYYDLNVSIAVSNLLNAFDNADNISVSEYKEDKPES